MVAPLVLLVLAGDPLWGQPVVSLDDRQVPGLLGAEQRLPSVAAHDAGYVLAWEDYRNGTYWPDIYFMRVAPGGVPLEPEGVPVAAGPGGQRQPAVACGSSSCAVAYVADPGLVVTLQELRFDGTTGAPMPITTISDGHALAYSGGQYLLVVADSQLLHLQRFDDNLSPLMPSVTSARRVFAPSAAAWPGGFFLGWQTNAGQIELSTFVDGGFSTPAVLLGPGSRNVSVGANADGGYAAWVEDSPDGGTQTRIVGMGFPAPGVPVELASGALNTVGIAGYGSGFFCGWLNDTVLDGLLLPSAPMPRFLATAGRSWDSTHAAAFRGGTGLIAFRNHELLTARLHMMVFDVATVPSAAVPLIRAASDPQTHVRAAWNGSGFVTIWHAERGGHFDVIARPLTAVGAPAGPPIDVAVGGGLDHSAPAVAFNGQHTLAMFTVADRLAYVWLRPDAVPETAGARILPQASGADPALAVVNGDVYAAWSQYDNTIGQNIGVERFLVDGGLGNTQNLFVAPPNRNASAPALAAVGSTLLLVWTDWTDETGRFLLFDPTWQPLPGSDGGTVFALTPVVAKGGISTAADGNHLFLIAWATHDEGVYAVRVNDDGVMLDAAPLVLQPPVGNVFQHVVAQAHPHVAFDGISFVVTWMAVNADAGTDALACRVYVDGSVTPTVELFAGPHEDEDPVLAQATTGRLLATWSSFDPAFGALRARARIIAAVPDGQPCWSPSDCLDGACVVGLCCAGERCLADGGGVQGDGGMTPGADGGTGLDALRVTCACDSSGLGLAGWVLLVWSYRLRRRRS